MRRRPSHVEIEERYVQLGQVYFDPGGRGIIPMKYQVTAHPSTGDVQIGLLCLGVTGTSWWDEQYFLENCALKANEAG